LAIVDAPRRPGVELAKRLDVTQGNVAQIEKRGDLLVSTLASYMHAVGGDVRIVVQFPGGHAIEVELDALTEPTSLRRQSRRASHRNRAILSSDRRLPVRVARAPAVPRSQGLVERGVPKSSESAMPRNVAARRG